MKIVVKIPNNQYSQTLCTLFGKLFINPISFFDRLFQNQGFQRINVSKNGLSQN